MIDGVLGSSSLPALERSLQFMSARQKLLAANLANAETPGYRAVDVDPAAFQASLREALDEGRTDAQGGIAFDDAAPVAFGPRGTELRPEFLGDNILFHDGTDGSVERAMQRISENTYAFRMAAQLMRSQFEMINAAIRERP
ncbi:MAG: flagellar basal body rod protein FlgB [Phycisphaerales bacterium]|jgi:flagellar basal-body rod protein FlgB